MWGRGMYGCEVGVNELWSGWVGMNSVNQNVQTNTIRAYMIGDKNKARRANAR
jgi:hypothetical protein